MASKQLIATLKEKAAAVLKKKLDAVEETGADLLVTDCPGCVLPAVLN